jgi:adenylate kinase
MKIVLLGPPGAGKGTLAGSLKEMFGVVHISTGDILRDEMKSGSKLGRQMRDFVENGKLVPDEVITQILENYLRDDPRLKEKGYLLDGFPRTEPQARDLDKILQGIQQPLDFAVYMKASLPVIIHRLTGRRVCRDCGALFHMQNKPPKTNNTCDVCGGSVYQRPDDNEETIKTRMDEYLRNTGPVFEYYERQKKLRTIDSDKDSDELLTQLLELLNETQGSDQDQNSGRA